jgi:hypothetical protein
VMRRLQTYWAVVEVEEGGAEELGALPENLLCPRPVVRRRRVVEVRHLRGGAAILRHRDGGRGGEAGVRPAMGERGLEQPPGGGEALHVYRLFALLG